MADKRFYREWDILRILTIHFRNVTRLGFKGRLQRKGTDSWCCKWESTKSTGVSTLSVDLHVEGMETILCLYVVPQRHRKKLMKSSSKYKKSHRYVILREVIIISKIQEFWEIVKYQICIQRQMQAVGRSNLNIYMIFKLEAKKLKK